MWWELPVWFIAAIVLSVLVSYLYSKLLKYLSVKKPDSVGVGLRKRLASFAMCVVRGSKRYCAKNEVNPTKSIRQQQQSSDNITKGIIINRGFKSFVKNIDVVKNDDESETQGNNQDNK